MMHEPLASGYGAKGRDRRRRIAGTIFTIVCVAATLVGVVALVVLLADVLAD